MSKNTPEESSEKKITDIHQHVSQETDDTVEDTTYKMSPHMKLTPKMKNEIKKNVLELKLKKRGRVLKKNPSSAKCGKLSVVQHDHQKKCLKRQENTSIGVQDPKPMQNPAEIDTKHKKIFHTRMSPVGNTVHSYLEEDRDNTNGCSSHIGTPNLWKKG
ncbi:hypothetical protein Cgig2_008289 [Carnegiea gigantea]|uniref:Uncharacterized protein n=1 Tax=Carnegiea gigantea TaxID=171969 RepID=A0A9Q1GZD4_9CARY|nr:hypothetical protein Cgig2_008289 [Carnegiea gigantea]